MSIKSTYGIRRETALQIIVSSIFQLSDQQLADLLDSLPQSTYRNYMVGYIDTNEERMINSVEEFFSSK